MARKKTDAEFRGEATKKRGNDFEVLSRYRGSRRKVAVRHLTCGFVYAVRADAFLRNAECPKCVGQVRYSDYTIRKRLKEAKNGEYVFCETYKGAGTRIKTLHVVCGKYFTVTPNKLINFDSGCRHCKRTHSKGEAKIEKGLNMLGVEYVQEKTFADLPRYRFDFYLPKYNYCIEFDGQQHYRPIEHWGGEERFLRNVSNDNYKNDYCDYKGIGLIRIPWYHYKDIPKILKELKKDLDKGKSPDYLVMPIAIKINIHEMETILK